MFDVSKKNKMKSGFIIAFFITMVALIAYFICVWLEVDSALVIPICMGIAIFSSIGTYYNSDKIVLSLNHARPATKEQNQRMVENLEGLCIAAGVPMPKLYIVEDPAPNAFATGRNPEHAVICVTTGLLSKLNDYELEGVLAHELSHIKNYDILIQTIVTVCIGFINIVADIFMRSSFRSSRRSSRSNDKGSNAQAILLLIGLIFIILSPIVAPLVQLALSRRREYLADSSAVELTRNPEGLINALIKISDDPEQLATATESSASMYICNPLKGKSAKTWLAKLYMTHPPIEDRINALKHIN